MLASAEAGARGVSSIRLLTFSAVALAACAVGLSLLAENAEATHYQGGWLNWEPVPGASGAGVFTGKIYFRHDHAIPEILTLDFGDGTSMLVETVPVGLVNPAEGWSESNLVPTPHIYPGTGPYTATLSTCCMYGPIPLFDHLNNPHLGYRIDIRVTPSDRTPVVTDTPFYACPQPNPCQFQIDARDPNTTPVTYSLPTSARLPAGWEQPGPPYTATAASVTSSGLVTWYAAGAPTTTMGGWALYSMVVDVNAAPGRTQYMFMIGIPCATLPSPNVVSCLPCTPVTECLPDPCPPGYTGFEPNCVRPPPSCPSGSYGTYPHCASIECRTTGQWVVPYSDFHGSPSFDIDDVGSTITSYTPFSSNGVTAHRGSGPTLHGSVDNAWGFWTAVYGTSGYVPTGNANWNTVAYAGSDLPQGIETARNDLLANVVPTPVGGGHSDMTIVLVTTGHDLSSSGIGKDLEQQVAAAKAAGIRIAVIHVQDGYGDLVGVYDNQVELQSIAYFANPTGTGSLTPVHFYYQVPTTADIWTIMGTFQSDLWSNGFPFWGQQLPQQPCLPNAPYVDCEPLGPMECIQPCPPGDVGIEPFCVPVTPPPPTPAGGLDASGAFHKTCLGYAASSHVFIVSHGTDPTTGADSADAQCADSSTGAWVTLPTANVARSQAAGTLTFGAPVDGYWVIGGKGPTCAAGTTGNICDTLEHLSPSGGPGWTVGPPMPLPAAGLGAAADPFMLYAMGGRDCDLPYCTATPYADLRMYDTLAGVWMMGPPMPTPRADLAVAQEDFGGPCLMIYAIGGNQGAGMDLATIDMFDTCAMTWVPSTVPPMPVAVSNAVAGWCNGSLVVVGGTTGGSPSNVIQRFNTPSSPGTWDPPVTMGTAGYRLAVSMNEDALGFSDVQMAAYPGDPAVTQVC